MRSTSIGLNVMLSFASNMLRQAALYNQHMEEHHAALKHIYQVHYTALCSTYFEHSAQFTRRYFDLQQTLLRSPEAWPQQWAAYLIDSWQRQILFQDALRQRGDLYLELEEQGAKPVLAFDYEMVLDGRTQKKPTNYALVRILPRPNDPEPEPKRRPYLIVDPRAGQGAGIGGSKTESQVGIALSGGHPVYFTIFFPQPEPEQTLADVCSIEAAFVSEIRQRHPQAPLPIVVGNCQGGWAVALLAATHSNLTGPIVLNGAPLSYWAGERGRHVMRYLGGINGGALPILLLSDLGGGRFDGAHLIFNFETLNPSNTWWSKYYRLYSQVDSEINAFLHFERWWSGFYFMNESEIRWILENLFIGNRLGQGAAMLDARTPIDLKKIRAPIIVFASSGDTITPPQQALNWIPDTYQSTSQIRVLGQRILYLLDEHIGHLGIFVSSNVAKHQHSQIASTMKTIEALPPGLYQMIIDQKEGEGDEASFTVSFHERTLDDILALDDGRDDEQLFNPLSRLSALNVELYEIFYRPLVQALVTPELTQWLHEVQPLRLKRTLASSRNPLQAGLPLAAALVKATRMHVPADLPLRRFEQFGADMIESQWNWLRDLRAAHTELSFFSVYAQPWMRRIAQNVRDDDAGFDLQQMPEVRLAAAHLQSGGFADGLVRILILLALARGSVRRDRLERSSKMLASTEPLASLTEQQRRYIINQQALIVNLMPEQALDALPHLLIDPAQRKQAMSIVRGIAGPLEEMNEPTRLMLQAVADRLDVPL